MRRYLDHQPPRSASPLYFFSTGQFLTRNTVTSILRLQLHRLGFATESYASHSFRIGAATTAAEASLPPWRIQTLGRWSSTCYTQYTRTPASILHAVPSRLAATCNMPLQSWDPTTGQCTPFLIGLVLVLAGSIWGLIWVHTSHLARGRLGGSLIPPIFSYLQVPGKGGFCSLGEFATTPNHALGVYTHRPRVSSPVSLALGASANRPSSGFGVCVR